MMHAMAVKGVDLDPETRCRHYHGPTDVVALKFKCCGEYYACKDCHAELADHAPVVWSLAEWDEPAVRCGVCGAELTIRQYVESGARCPACSTAFNPKCRAHYRFYFEERQTG